MASQPANATKPKKQVALIIETSNEYARGILRGVRRYIRENANWSIYIEEFSRGSAFDFNWLAQWEGDGIVARIENRQIADSVIQTGLPIVDLSAFRLLPNVPFVETDDNLISRFAYEHFTERGFKNFAFLGDSHFIWSQQRRFHFKNCIQQHGYPYFEYDLCHTRRESRIADRDDLAAWVLTLPKPIGIMAAFDHLGLQILESCRFAQVAVPEEVAVIGVDNDPLMTELSDPPLSSIIPDTNQTGYHAAYLLEQLMNGKEADSLAHLMKPIGIATRRSTDVLAIEDPMIAKALHYIREYACEGINVLDVLNVIPLSRRALEHRFLKCFGKTPHEAITQVKLNKAKDLLLETDLSIAHISELSGFPNLEYLSVVFKKSNGLSPGAYRKKHKVWLPG